jgi:4-hydroxybenzoate polyprenyltransferase
MSLGVWLRLGRVSNLPTLWSNVLATLALSGALSLGPRVFALSAIFSLYYVGGMYLNDAFDRHIDAQQRPDRPIPSGQVSARVVFGLGFAALLAATLLLGLVAQAGDASLSRALASGAGLALLIVGYDVYHKQNPLSPVVMGLCRVMVYVAGAFAVRSELALGVVWGAAALLCHLIGLSYAAKQEAYNRLTRVWPLGFLAAPAVYGVYLALAQPLVWPFLLAYALWTLLALRFLRPGPQRSVPQAIVRLIAAIALLDAVFIASTGSWGWALAAAAFAALTRLFQRYIPGT